MTLVSFLEIEIDISKQTFLPAVFILKVDLLSSPYPEFQDSQPYSQLVQSGSVCAETVQGFLHIVMDPDK